MIESLRAVNFRCFSELSLELPREGGLFIGVNAQGKTSLLEAICVLVRLHSPRTHRNRLLVKSETKGFGVGGVAWEQQRKVEYSQGSLSLQVEKEERSSQSEYLQDGGLVVWLGNEDMELVRGPGEKRRRYLDFVAGQMVPNYSRALSRYKKVLKARNALLRQGRHFGGEWKVYTRLLAENGEVLRAGRREVVVGLTPYVLEQEKGIAGTASMSLLYVESGGPDLAQSYEEAALREREFRQTLLGPHRDDLSLLINGMSASDYASEGQQRTFALALKLGQGRLFAEEGRVQPVYLLDDVFGELDMNRREALLAHLPKQSQCLMTTTSMDWLGREFSQGRAFYEVSNGEVVFRQ